MLPNWGDRETLPERASPGRLLDAEVWPRGGIFTRIRISGPPACSDRSFSQWNMAAEDQEEVEERKSIWAANSSSGLTFELQQVRQTYPSFPVLYDIYGTMHSAYPDLLSPKRGETSLTSLAPVRTHLIFNAHRSSSFYRLLL